MNRIFIVILSLLFLATSCDKSEHVNDVSKTSELSTYKEDVNKTILIFKGLNDSILNLPNYSTNRIYTRGWGNFFNKVIAIAGADLVGAAGGMAAVKEIAIAAGMATEGTGAAVVLAVGGAIGAASASELANKTMESSVSINDFTASTAINAYQEIKEIPIDYVKLNFPERFDYMNVMGGIHNAIIDKVNESEDGTIPMLPALTRSLDEANPPTDLPGGTIASLPDFLQQGSLQNISCTSSAEFQTNEVSLLNSTAFSQVCTNLINETNDACSVGVCDIDALLKNISVSLADNEKTIIDFYTKLYYSYPESINDVIFIANEYIKKIEAMDNLTESEKATLYLSISISANSAYYWSK